MKQMLMGIVSIHLAACLAQCQSTEPPPKFEIADVHLSPKTTNAYLRVTPVHANRYELKNATMVDLVHLAYGFDADKVLGGPNWLEMEHYDVLAKTPPDSTPETHKLMLQSLLEDRFKLVVHKDTKPLPTYALIVGKKPQLKESDGSGETGCHPQAASGPSPEGGMRIMMSSGSGSPTTLNLGPGMTIQYNCRNMTMAAFADGLRNMLGASLGNNPVLDQTGLKGSWNFDLRFSLQIFGPAIANTGDRVTLFEAVEKQLGLKLEEKQVPTPVIVVDSVNQAPTGNPPGLAEALPPTPLPTEFEVASVKPADTTAGMVASRFQMQAGGRLNAQGMPLRFLVGRAFPSNTTDQLVGLPGWADSERFDIIAKAPSSGPTAPGMDMDAIAPMMRALLVDRFKMTYHTEERPLPAYSLVSAKPKLKKADPASRTSCKNNYNPPGAPPGTQVMTCQNITMAQFAERLRGMGPGLTTPILDATGIEGGWDFTLSYSQAAAMAIGGGRGGEPAAAAAAPAASDPTGGYTIFEAIEKQLGLKLEMQKRPIPVVVIDHIEQKPTDN